MPHYNSIFHQLLKVIPRHRFERLVDVHKGDYRARHLRCWDQFVSLLYAQLTGCDSRNVQLYFTQKLIAEMGMQAKVSKSSGVFKVEVAH